MSWSSVAKVRVLSSSASVVCLEGRWSLCATVTGIEVQGAGGLALGVVGGVSTTCGAMTSGVAVAGGVLSTTVWF